MLYQDYKKINVSSELQIENKKNCTAQIAKPFAHANFEEILIRMWISKPPSSTCSRFVVEIYSRLPVYHARNKLFFDEFPFSQP